MDIQPDFEPKPAPAGSWLSRANAPTFFTASNPRRAGRTPSILLGALRGKGAMVGPEGPMPVLYEIDAFSAGRIASAKGSVEGDFRSWTAPDGEMDVLPLHTELYLENGQSLSVVVVAIAPDLIEFDLPCDTKLLSLLGRSLADAMGSPLGSQNRR